MANEQFSMYWGPHHLWGARGQAGSKLEQGEQAGAAGVRGVSWERVGASWSKGSELERGEQAGSELEQAEQAKCYARF